MSKKKPFVPRKPLASRNSIAEKRRQIISGRWKQFDSILAKIGCNETPSLRELLEFPRLFAEFNAAMKAELRNSPGEREKIQSYLEMLAGMRKPIAGLYFKKLEGIANQLLITLKKAGEKRQLWGVFDVIQPLLEKALNEAGIHAAEDLCKSIGEVVGGDPYIGKDPIIGPIFSKKLEEAMQEVRKKHN